ncbi:hypothetical protein [Pararhizobium sp. A13]|uniref:hypothetical protein n=1 Tax=Pararhizobium sp. A13 TaxID=3133975 RepID=UPI00311AC351
MRPILMIMGLLSTSTLTPMANASFARALDATMSQHEATVTDEGKNGDGTSLRIAGPGKESDLPIRQDHRDKWAGTEQFGAWQAYMTALIDLFDHPQVGRERRERRTEPDGPPQTPDDATQPPFSAESLVDRFIVQAEKAQALSLAIATITSSVVIASEAIFRRRLKIEYQARSQMAALVGPARIIDKDE